LAKGNNVLKPYKIKMEANSIVELFKRMGLSGFDAKVYLKLLSKGSLNIPELAEELSSYKPQIHESLHRLLTKGLVEVSKGKPTLYRAIDPLEVLSIFREENKKLEIFSFNTYPV